VAAVVGVVIVAAAIVASLQSRPAEAQGPAASKAGDGKGSGDAKGGPPAGPPPAAVAVAVADERPIAVSRSFVGTLMPLQRSTVGSAVDGRVIDFATTEGDWVQQGQTLCQLLTKTISIEIEAAKAEFKLRLHEYEELKTGSRPEEISRAKAKLEEARALMIFTRDKLARTQRLHQTNVSASREELDQAQSQATAAEQLFQAEARMQSAQEQVNLLNDRLEKYTIKAPFDGYVVAEHTEQGEWIKSGDPIVEVIAIDPIEVTVQVPENYISGLQAAVADDESRQVPTLASVRVEAFAPDTFEGQVVRIVPQADLRARTFPVKVRLSNPLQGRAHALKAGMLAQVTLPVGKPSPGILVPKDALVLGQRGTSVFVVVTEPESQLQVAREVPVETGLSEGQLIQVKGAITKGQQVVVRGNERIRDGQPVEVISTATSAATSARAER
jgi:HlyD family secretion protein